MLCVLLEPGDDVAGLVQRLAVNEQARHLVLAALCLLDIGVACFVLAQLCQAGKEKRQADPSLGPGPIVARSEALRQAMESGIGAKADEIASNSQSLVIGDVLYRLVKRDTLSVLRDGSFLPALGDSRLHSY